MVYDPQEARFILNEAANQILEGVDLQHTAGQLLDELVEEGRAVGLFAQRLGPESGWIKNAAALVGDGRRDAVEVAFVGGGFTVFHRGSAHRTELARLTFDFDRRTGTFVSRSEERFTSPVPGDPVYRRRSALADLAEAVTRELRTLLNIKP